MIDPMECVAWAVKWPRKAVTAVLIGVAVALPIVIAGWFYAVSTAPVIPTLLDMRIWRGDAGTIYVEAHYQSAAPPKCLRQDARVLVGPTDPANPGSLLSPIEAPTYVEIGAGQGDRGLTGSVYNYRLLFWLPADFPFDSMSYIVREHYECEPFGLRHWEYTLPIVPIVVPPRGGAG